MQKQYFSKLRKEKIFITFIELVQYSTEGLKYSFEHNYFLKFDPISLNIRKYSE